MLLGGNEKKSILSPILLLSVEIYYSDKFFLNDKILGNKECGHNEGPLYNESRVPFARKLSLTVI